MKISIQTANVLDVVGIDEGFAMLKKAGAEAVDLALDIGMSWDELKQCRRCGLFATETSAWDYAKEVKAAAEKYGIEIGQCHAPAPSYFPHTDMYPHAEEATKMMWEIIAESIRICRYVGCSHIVVHPCCDGSARYPSLTKEEDYKWNIAFYSYLIPTLKETGVTCCLENMYCQDWGTKKTYLSACSDMNETLRYLDELNGIAGEKLFAFCLDIGHCLLLGIDPCDALVKLGDKVELLHIHDNDGFGDLHIAPYLGVCNWERFLKGLHAIGYKGNLSFETAAINRKFPKEVLPEVLGLIAGTGRYFRDRLNAMED